MNTEASARHIRTLLFRRAIMKLIYEAALAALAAENSLRHLCCLRTVFTPGRKNIVVEWLAFLLRILKALGLNLGTVTGYPDRDFLDFLSPSL
jgi:hypothetical protein